ncbi:sigma 54-interacting transcriptional regulator [Edaphobacillus lindanitolerans]|uniref:Arginine utilization regulatory protein n=1 Tax=Edaphobacillus lindanitolerans TaxID=550447 RepID=A0A1U7PQA7_9BACI|nr:sigma 54-interacting transcriptional regulator [Edaphobacillus lindanitolerans]SIT92117.1 arginine utilization regulatory protein [Edaphobacillus lindanitolerans]
MAPEKEALWPFFEFAVEHAAVGVHAVDMAGKTVIYNEKMKQIEGLDLSDLTDRTVLDLFRFGKNESTLMQVLKSGVPVLNAKQTYWNRTGQEITTVNDTYPVAGPSGMIGAIELARDVTALEKFVHQPLRTYDEKVTFASITAVSDSMKGVVATAKKAAAARLPVLLSGETGTGKDLLAGAIHNGSSSSGKSYYTLFCPGLDTQDLRNSMEQIREDPECTVFCDRIDLAGMKMQEELLRELNRLGEDHRQFIASIGGDAIDLIAEGSLLKELYYFFSSITIYIPPLRKRIADLWPFIDDYLELHRRRFGSAVQGLSPEVQQTFESYRWPGNLKEVELLLDEVTSVLTTETEITYDLLPHHFKLKVQEGFSPAKRPQDFVVQEGNEFLPLDQYLREAEEYYLSKVMNVFEGNVTKAAQALGMSRQNLQYHLKKLKNGI